MAGGKIGTKINVAGKLIMGILSDKIGIYRSMHLFLLCVAASMAIFLFGKGLPTALYAASLAYGAVYSIYATAPPLVFLDLYGSETGAEKLPKMQAVNSIVGALISAGIPYVYDLTGSFDPVFIYGILICVLSFVLVVYLQKCSVWFHRTGRFS